MNSGINYKKIGFDIIGAAFEVKKNSGNGLREKYYKYALAWELKRLGYNVGVEVPVKALYKGIEISEAYYADIIVEDSIVIEVKALKKMVESEPRQLFTYLHLGNYKLGYLINFGATDFSLGNLSKDRFPYVKGIYRMVNGINFSS